jgi:hypothetical protein
MRDPRAEFDVSGLRQSRSGLMARAEWPPIETEPADGPAWPELDAETINRSVNGTLPAKIVSARIKKGILRPFRAGPSRALFKLANGRSADVFLKPVLPRLEQEMRFYEEISPRLTVGLPRFLGAIENRSARGPAGWLMLEAIPDTTQVPDLTADHLRAALGALAELHATFWNSPMAADFEWLPIASESDPAVLSARVGYALDAIVERQLSLPHFPRLIDDGLKAGLERIAHDLEPALAPLRALPATVLHGDTSLHNFVFSRAAHAAGGARLRVSMIDWQLACRGPAIIDLVHLYNSQFFRRVYRYRRKRDSQRLIDWPEFSAFYFHALERRLGFAIDRQAQLAAIDAVIVNMTVRRWLVFAGLIFSAGQLDFLFGSMAPMLKPLTLWADLPGFIEQFIRAPIERVVPAASAIYGSGIFRV